MRNKKQILKKITKSVTKYYGNATDFQLVWALSKNKIKGAEIIEVVIVSGDIFKDIMRMEKIELLAGEIDCITEKRLHSAIRKYSEDFDVSIEEFVPF